MSAGGLPPPDPPNPNLFPVDGAGRALNPQGAAARFAALGHNPRMIPSQVTELRIRQYPERYDGREMPALDLQGHMAGDEANVAMYTHERNYASRERSNALQTVLSLTGTSEEPVQLIDGAPLQTEAAQRAYRRAEGMHNMLRHFEDSIARYSVREDLTDFPSNSTR